MESDKVVRSMAQWWQSINQDDYDFNNRNSMPYDQLEYEGMRTSKKMQYVAAFVVCLGSVATGTALAWTSPVFLQLSKDPNGNETLATNISSSNNESLQLNTEQLTWISSLLAVGAFFGALPSGYMADAIGRRYTAIAMDIPFIIAWLAIIFAKSAGMLYFGRFMMGISTGSFCIIVPMYISEIAEVNMRGILGSLFQLLLTIGILFAYIVGSLVNWINLSAFCLLIPVIFFVGMIFLPETPKYLLKKGHRGEAVLSLKLLWGHYCDTRIAIQYIQNELDQSNDDISFFEFFRNRSTLKGFIISALLLLFQQFSGINAIIFYMVSVFQLSNNSFDPLMSSIFVGIVQVIMTMISSFLIERIGRKSLLLFSSTIMTVCLAILGSYFNMKNNGKDVNEINWLPLICLASYMITFSIGYGPIPWLMMGELFLPNVRSTAVTLAVMVNWLAVFSVTKSFGSMISTWGSDVTFWFFATCTLIATIYVALAIVETKGKSLIEIQAWLNGEK